MSLGPPNRHILGAFSARGIAIVAILVIGLLGGLFHHHESASDSDGCSYCHACVQTPVIDPAGALITPIFAVVGRLVPQGPLSIARILAFSSLASRAPPVPTQSIVL